jgi:hypothetical protein
MRIDRENRHQILFPGIVVDVKDPAMLGRIRARPITKDVESMISGIDTDKIENGDLKEQYKWTTIDPLVFIPLLPFFVSQVPRESEYIHIIYMNKEFQNKNQFYIQGPFSSPMNSPKEVINSSEKDLAIGDLIKPTLDIRNPDGSFKVDWSEGVFPMPGDNAILGRRFSDIIFKSRQGETGLEDSVLIRAGKTKSLVPGVLPRANNNRSFLQLSYFGQEKITNGIRNQSRFEEIVKLVKKIIIWDIQNLENGQNSFNGSVGLYNVIFEGPDVEFVNNEYSPGSKVNSKNFQSDTILNLSPGTDYSGPLEEIKFTAKTFEEVSNLINKFIEGVFKGSLTNIPSYAVKSQSNLLPEQTFPFVVTPSKQTYETGVKFSPSQVVNDVKELVNYTKFYDKIKLNQGLVNSGWFLVWENKNGTPLIGPQADVKIESVTETDFIDNDISYAVLGGEKIFLLSQRSEGPKGKVSLNDTIYGINQDKFVGDNTSIQNRTYPTVRGDELMILLRKIFSYVTGHVHAVSTLPPIPVAAGNGQTSAEIDSILANAENTVLNQQIRIN